MSRKLSLTAAVFACALISAPAQADDEVGLVKGTFAATYAAGSPAGCGNLLMTGQFIAPTPGYKLVVKPKSPQAGVTVYELELTIVPPSGTVPQVITPMPLSYQDASYDGCPYGVSLSYEKQVVLVPYSARQVTDTVDQTK